MSYYRRANTPGGCYFFTVVTRHRIPFFSTPDNVQLLREAIRKMIEQKPFCIDAMVVLPDHFHTLWQLPDGNADFSSRWREIKKYVSRHAQNRGDSVWQRRFWEHLIRDENDWQRHMDYIHYNPVKHGWSETPATWPYSSFSRCVKKGLYEANWGRDGEPVIIKKMWLE